MGIGVASRRSGQVVEAVLTLTTILEKELKGEDMGVLWRGQSEAALTGLMSRCRNPTEWMASMDSRICLPSRSVVLSVKVPLGWLRRRSAKFRPWGRGGAQPSSVAISTTTAATLCPASPSNACAHFPLLPGPRSPFLTPHSKSHSLSS